VPVALPDNIDNYVDTLSTSDLLYLLGEVLRFVIYDMGWPMRDRQEPVELLRGR
jgi:hypothetical protein